MYTDIKGVIRSRKS